MKNLLIQVRIFLAGILRRLLKITQKADVSPQAQIVWLNLRFILFLTVLALFYIANNHVANKKMGQINLLTKELKELNWQLETERATLTTQSRLSEVASSASEIGLEVPRKPAQPIIVNK